MSERVYDVCIIGAGASGLVAAIESSRRGLSCVVVDKNKKPGMKLYATGNGRCNLTNDTWEEDSYYENEFVDKVYNSLYNITELRQRSFVIDYFKKLGINTVNKDGYFYPSSMQASSVVWALLDAASYAGVEILERHTCTGIDYVHDPEYARHGTDIVYEVKCINKIGDDTYNVSVFSKNIIIATGGASQKKLGAADSSLSESIFNSLRLDYTDFRAGLCPVTVNDDLSAVAGVRTKAKLSVGRYSEIGEVQITENGLSGIVTFNMSYYMEEGTVVNVNLLPRVSESEFVEYYNLIRGKYSHKRLDAFLNGYINDKLASYMIEKIYHNKDQKLRLKDVNTSDISKLYQKLTSWNLVVKSKAGFDESQASYGGINTDIIDSYTMEIDEDHTIGKGIYAVGEATDVMGKCGGYNLTYAFVTGFLAGNAVEV